MNIEIRNIVESDSQWVRNLMREHWGSEIVVSRGRIHHADQLRGFVAWEDDVRVGLLTYRIENDSCEIVSLNALQPERGIGRALVKSACTTATAHRCKRVWLITTNDNTPAMRFYEKIGFSLSAVHHNAVEVSRKLKPEIPEIGIGGVPISDEVEYELLLSQEGIE
jgi:N-acetylglutamate synthase-like GNAT family acetyltransferase